jgi:hypothetical protein
VTSSCFTAINPGPDDFPHVLYAQCKGLHTKVLPALYRTVLLDGAASSIRTLAMLARHPEIGRHVRELVIRFPDSGGSRSQALEGYQVSKAVSDAVRSLDALETFVWEGPESAPEDSMWFALRFACPQLKNIHTTFGGWPPDPKSNVRGRRMP